MDIIKNGMVTNNVGLNFSEPDGIIGQIHVYYLSLVVWICTPLLVAVLQPRSYVENNTCNLL